MKFSIDEIIAATGAKILKKTVSDTKFSLCTDTRSINPGEIYLPLKGANFDGENFIEQALSAGAAGYFTTQEQVFENSQLVLQVEDTLIAYLELARFYKRKINPKTVAITGSCGKTTTKEMAYCVAKEKFITHKSELNFNNEIGLCKTILSMPKDTEVLILEMGMRGLGEIELLSRFSEPDITIVSNVGTAHIGRLGSRENIAVAKCEIVKFQNPNGVFISLNDEMIKNTVKFCGKKIYFSLNDSKILETRIGHSKFEYKNFEYELNIEGDYNVQNALGVIEMGLALKMAPQQIASGLKKYSPIEKRWEIQEVSGLKIINDSYNANPESMQAAIKTGVDTTEGKLLFVLGDMGELGENEAFYHQEVGVYLLEQLQENVKVVTVGKLAGEISKKLKEAGISSENFVTNEDVSRYIVENIESGTTIILKASRSMKFEEILDGIKNKMASVK